MIEEILIRQTTIVDVPDLVRLRRIMFVAMGFNDQNQLKLADIAAESYFTKAIPKKEFLGWLAISPTGEPVGSGGIVIDHHPPGPENTSGKIGYIMNLVVVPKYRGIGIAKKIMHSLLEWLKESEVQIVSLHATEYGRQLYEELGFTQTNEMRLKLNYHL